MDSSTCQRKIKKTTRQKDINEKVDSTFYTGYSYMQKNSNILYVNQNILLQQIW